MATAAVVKYHQEGRALEGFFLSASSVKPTASQDRVEGRIQPGDRVAVVDDVFTQGSSVLQAIAEVERLGRRRGPRSFVSWTGWKERARKWRRATIICRFSRFAILALNPPPIHPFSLRILQA